MFLIWTYSVCLPTCLRNVCVVQRWCTGNTGYRIQWYETETNSLNNCSRGFANLNRIEVVDGKDEDKDNICESTR